MSQQIVDDSVILSYLKRGMTYDEIVTATKCGKNRIARIAKLNGLTRPKGRRDITEDIIIDEAHPNFYHDTDTDTDTNTKIHDFKIAADFIISHLKNISCGAAKTAAKDLEKAIGDYL